MMMDDFGYFDGYDIDYNGLDTRPAKMLLCRFSIGANPFHKVCRFYLTYNHLYIIEFNIDTPLKSDLYLESVSIVEQFILC